MREQDDVSIIETTLIDKEKKTNVRDLLNRYWGIVKKSARAAIEKGTLFFEAEALSDENDRNAFYVDIGHDRRYDFD